MNKPLRKIILRLFYFGAWLFFPIDIFAQTPSPSPTPRPPSDIADTDADTTQENRCRGCLPIASEILIGGQGHCPAPGSDGHRQSVELLQSDETLSALLYRLDANTFAERERAFRELRGIINCRADADIQKLEALYCVIAGAGSGGYSREVDRRVTTAFSSGRKFHRACSSEHWSDGPFSLGTLSEESIATADVVLRFTETGRSEDSCSAAVNDLWDRLGNDYVEAERRYTSDGNTIQLVVIGEPDAGQSDPSAVGCCCEGTTTKTAQWTQEHAITFAPPPAASPVPTPTPK